MTRTVEWFGPVLRIRTGVPEWVIAYLDDETGTLMVTSDYGDWTYRWGLVGMPKGVPFHRFILERAEGHFDYVANKLTLGTSMILDVEATRRELRIAYAREWRDGDYDGTADDYRDLMDDIAECQSHEDFYGSEYIGINVYLDCVREKHSREYNVLCDRILPALTAAFQPAEVQPCL